MNSVEDLDAFKLANKLALKVYSVTKTFSKKEKAVRRDRVFC
jgi:hypothetical protein